MKAIMNLLGKFFTPETFMEALPIMGKGMVGIFLVTGVIILSIMALNHFTAKAEKK